MNIDDLDELFGDDPNGYNSDDNVQRYDNDEAEEVPSSKKTQDSSAQLDLEAKKKKVIKNPQPKLDADRICGKRGVGLLEDIFKDFDASENKNVYDNIDVVMKKMGHWAHRLYPKLPFDDVMDRISVLGKKQAIKTYVKKVRLEMITVPTEKDKNDEDVDGEDNTLRYDQPEEENWQQQGDDEFDDLFKDMDIPEETHQNTSTNKSILNSIDSD